MQFYDIQQLMLTSSAPIRAIAILLINVKDFKPKNKSNTLL